MLWELIWGKKYIFIFNNLNKFRGKLQQKLKFCQMRNFIENWIIVRKETLMELRNKRSQSAISMSLRKSYISLTEGKKLWQITDVYTFPCWFGCWSLWYPWQRKVVHGSGRRSFPNTSWWSGKEPGCWWVDLELPEVWGRGPSVIMGVLGGGNMSACSSSRSLCGLQMLVRNH